ncbi:MAG: hypothetical protein H0X03_01665 [Nitrosopumilus sp.]|nr:hypothetical protein [Nitrosopumilus sp.]
MKKIHSIFLTLALVLAYFISGTYTALSQGADILENTSNVLLQYSDEKQQNMIQISKNSTNLYNIINHETTLVGTFDTTYTVAGSSDSLNKSRDLIISTIIGDFDKSPTIGYIRAENVTNPNIIYDQTEDMPSIGNPFVDINTINSTITQEISNVISAVHGRDFSTVAIKCDFGMNIKDFKCEDYGLIN